MTLKLLLLFFTLNSHLFAITEKQALDRINLYASNLKKELQKGLSKSPEEAVKTCHLQAPRLQKQASDDHMQIGRVSLKNRNPHNTPKDWMKKYIQDFHQGKIKKDHIVVSLDSGKQGLLKPIKMMPICLKCHGEHLSPEIQKVITTYYPHDKAKGYKLGEIRGFFWAEYSNEE